MKTEREKTEDGADKKDKPYERAVNQGTTSDVYNLNSSNLESSFVIPEVEIEDNEPAEEMVKIIYSKPKEIVEQVKKAIKARSFKKVGEETFDYFVKMEEIDNE